MDTIGSTWPFVVFAGCQFIVTCVRLGTLYNRLDRFVSSIAVSRYVVARTNALDTVAIMAIGCAVYGWVGVVGMCHMHVRWIVGWWVLYPVVELWVFVALCVAWLGVATHWDNTRDNTRVNEIQRFVDELHGEWMSKCPPIYRDMVSVEWLGRMVGLESTGVGQSGLESTGVK
jgi:hypothetical protein